MTALRTAHPVFRRRRFFDGRPIRGGDEVRDIAWLTPAGHEMTQQDWGSEFGRCVMVFLNGEALPEPDARGQRIIDDSFLLCFNADETPVDFVTPNTEYAQGWHAVIDTADPTGSTALAVQAGQAVTVTGRSLIIMQKSR